jgi:hypothetical protein
MKQHIKRALLITVALLSLAGTGILFADETTVNLESKIIQDFSKPENQNWFVMGSKFTTGDFPRSGIIKGGPLALLGGDPGAMLNARSLGIAMLFDRKEYNWVDIIPGTKDKPIELPLPGRVKMLDLWIWSGDFDYYVEAFFRDFRGIVHTLPMGDLNFVGWKNIRITIPDTIVQSKKYLPKREGLSLVKFRIWTKPGEVVVLPGAGGDLPAKTDPNYDKLISDRNLAMSVKFYFNNIKVLTDTFESLYDGDIFTNPDIYKDALGAGAKK